MPRATGGRLTIAGTHTHRRAPWWDGWICAAIVLAAYLAVWPFVEMGLIDDFSYAKTAWVFAATGHFVFNGWATAMLGWQIVWAAPFVKLLGPTFFAVRVASAALFVLSVPLTHAVLVRGGLTRERAIFGTLLVGLSPLTLPLSTTFMTDIAGLLVIVAGLYCAMRAVTSQTAAGVLGWLAAGFIVGAVGGTARQIAWLVSLVLLPSAARLVRRRRGAVALSVVLWLAGFACVIWCLHWFKHQPFNVPEPLKQGPLVAKAPRELAGTMLAALMCFALLLMPVFSEAFRPALRLRLKTWLLIAAGTVVSVLAIKFMTFHLVERGWLPWTGDIVGMMDVFVMSNLWMLGVPPITFNLAARIIGSVVVVAALLIFIAVLRRRRLLPASGDETMPHGTLSWRQLGVLLVPFTVAYWVLLIPRGIWAQILDRYLLPMLVVAAIVLLRISQERISRRVTALPWVVLAIFGLWSVAATHDWIAYHRARVTAVDRVMATGIPKWKISAGYEYDGLTQIEMAGAVADERVSYPHGFDTQLHFPPDLPQRCQSLYQTHTPALRPLYFLSFDAEPCLVPSGFPDATFRRWLPPFNGRIMILKLQP